MMSSQLVMTSPEHGQRQTTLRGRVLSVHATFHSIYAILSPVTHYPRPSLSLLLLFQVTRCFPPL